MEAERRMLSTAELEAIFDSLKETIEKSGNSLIKKCNDLELTIRRLAQLSLSQRVVIFYDKGVFIGILVFDVMQEWWSNDKFLVEHFLFCVNNNYKGFARDAIDELERLAKLFDCDVIVAGCYFNKDTQMVSNSYKKKGFTIMCPNYVKLLKE